MTDYNTELVNNCSGAVGPGAPLFQYWRSVDCPAAYAQLINTATDGTMTFNAEGLATAQQKVVQLFNTYFLTNILTDDVTSSKYSEFQETLHSLCIDSTTPGICEGFLGGYCSRYSREQTTPSPTLRNFCGCYVTPDPAYVAATVPACDPLCNRAETSQKVKPNGELDVCPDGVCVIDQNTIDVEGSKIPGGITFNQVCAGCGAGGCLCIIGSQNINKTASNLGLGSNFSQFCGGNSICIVKNAAGEVVSSRLCGGTVNPDQAPITSVSPQPTWIFVLFLLVFVLIGVVVVLAAREKK